MGTNGIDPMTQLRERDKCKLVPNKLIYKSSDEAWAKAIERSRETHLKIVPYACDGCGWFHLTSSDKVNDKVVPAQVGISTTTLRKKLPVNTSTIPIRKDMSEFGPTIPANFEAKVKVLTKYLNGKVAVTTADIHLVLGDVSAKSIGRYMKRVGWYSTRGRKPVWKPESEKKTAIVTPITHKKVVKMTDTITLNTDEEIKKSMDRHPSSQGGAGKLDFPAAVEQHNTRKQEDILARVGETPKYVDWRTMDISKIKDMTVSDLMKTLEIVGLELRIQAAFKD